ncbi:hypothetical protein B0F90DRAFT_1669766 [Multifurca ochricompacta]|uniref:Uncharacterized protein n=1 Tax=Multifurca ochricompacta TaxID=376703 RepID=A0AAD4M1U3_9AGAM|nr:hypothetical protein B0F90DRAFT_1669766 [Multifurca ochricompacta]
MLPCKQATVAIARGPELKMVSLEWGHFEPAKGVRTLFEAMVSPLRDHTPRLIRKSSSTIAGAVLRRRRISTIDQLSSRMKKRCMWALSFPKVPPLSYGYASILFDRLALLSRISILKGGDIGYRMPLYASTTRTYLKIITIDGSPTSGTPFTAPEAPHLSLLVYPHSRAETTLTYTQTGGYVVDRAVGALLRIEVALHWMCLRL